MNPTTVFTKTTFSKRMLAAAAVIGLATTGALIARNVPSAGEAISVSKPMAITQRVDVCSSSRPAGTWFPPQIEAQFAAQCDGSIGTQSINTTQTLRKRSICTMNTAERGWLPPQVEMQFAEWCA